MKGIYFILLVCSVMGWQATDAQQSGSMISVKENAITSLYGTRASRVEGSVAKQNGDFMQIGGPARMEWSVNVAVAGVYEINLCHSVKTKTGARVSILSGNDSIAYTLMPTHGVWGDGSFERILLPDRINLKAGGQMLTLTVTGELQDKQLMDLRSVELIPVAARSLIQADVEEAHRSRANSEWLAKAGYGVMFHWTSQSVNRDGTHKTYAQAVADFDLPAFVNMVESTGAGYVIFTIGHAEPYCPAPIRSWEKYHPGHTTKRDLIAEMADALNAKNIKLICYIPTHVLADYPTAAEKQFITINEEVMTEMGQRYGKKLSGYWFDGWYQCFETYPDVSFKNFFRACKTGNPDRIIALNSWIYPGVTEWQEYWAGETASPVAPPKEGTVERGPGKGLRYQSLIIMEPYWVQDKPSMPDPRFTPNELCDYIQKCMANGGAVTINLGIYQDGSIDAKALEVMKEVRGRIRWRQMTSVK